MGLFDRVRGLFGFGDVKTTVAYTGAPNFWMNLGLGKQTSSGQNISSENALALSIVYSCVSRISSAMAMLPIKSTRIGGDFEHIPTTAERLLNVSPDGTCTAYEFKQGLIAFSLLYPYGSARIYRDRDGNAERLELLHPNNVKQVHKNGRVFYQIEGEDRDVPADNMIIIPSLLRRSLVDLNRETLGLFKAAQMYASKFFDGGGVMNGLLTSEQPIEPEQIKTLLDTWERQQGKQTRMIPFGFKYHRLGVEPDKAQNTDSRKFEAEDICRIFGLPPAMVGLGTTSYGDYSDQARAFTNICIAPIAAKLENEYCLKFLTTDEQNRIEYRHDIDELMRGDIEARGNFYATMLDRGVFNRDEVRAKERMPRIEGGNIYTVQVNQIALTELEAYSKKISDGGI